MPDTEPSNATLRKLAKAAEAKGCSLCGARFASGLPYFIVRLARGHFANHCLDCRTTGAIPVFTTIYLGPDPWSQDDRAWFARHPHRQWRLREPVPGELAASLATEKAPPNVAAWMAAGRPMAVVVRQLKPGMRQRQPIMRLTEEPLDSFTDAGIVRTIRGLPEWAAETPPDEAALKRQRFEQLDQRVAVAMPFIRRD